MQSDARLGVMPPYATGSHRWRGVPKRSRAYLDERAVLPASSGMMR